MRDRTDFHSHQWEPFAFNQQRWVRRVEAVCQTCHRLRFRPQEPETADALQVRISLLEQTLNSREWYLKKKIRRLTRALEAIRVQANDLTPARVEAIIDEAFRPANLPYDPAQDPAG